MKLTHEQAQRIRNELRRCEKVWRDPDKNDEVEVLEALSTLLFAYALGSRTASYVLLDGQIRARRFSIPNREKALDSATSLRKLAIRIRQSRLWTRIFAR